MLQRQAASPERCASIERRHRVSKRTRVHRKHTHAHTHPHTLHTRFPWQALLPEASAGSVDDSSSLLRLRASPMQCSLMAQQQGGSEGASSPTSMQQQNMRLARSFMPGKSFTRYVCVCITTLHNRDGITEAPPGWYSSRSSSML